jgi:transcriptional regulator GlxA family with amidase domain
MLIYVLALHELFDTGLSTLLDTFGTANDLAKSAGTSSTRFDVTVVGVRPRVRTSHGLLVPVRLATRLTCPDVVLVPALGAKMPDTLRVSLERRDVKDAQVLLRRWSGSGTLVGAACTGTFVLAGTSLLDGQNATTSWWLAPFFRELYPHVVLDDSRMLVSSSRFVTAGAALAHLDLALWLVRRKSPALAALTARYLVVEPRPSQAAFAIPDHLAHSDPLVERFERWARRQLADGFSLSEAARAVVTSERTLARRLQSVLGKSPLAYVQDLRVERAVHLLQTSSASIDQIATQVGYADGVTLRTLIRRKIGRGVRELRARN